MRDCIFPKTYVFKQFVHILPIKCTSDEITKHTTHSWFLISCIVNLFSALYSSNPCNSDVRLGQQHSWGIVYFPKLMFSNNLYIFFPSNGYVPVMKLPNTQLTHDFWFPVLWIFSLLYTPVTHAIEMWD